MEIVGAKVGVDTLGFFVGELVGLDCEGTFVGSDENGEFEGCVECGELEGINDGSVTVGIKVLNLTA